MGKIIDFPGAERGIHNIKLERAMAVLQFRMRTDSNIMDAGFHASMTRMTLLVYAAHSIALGLAFMLLGKALTDGNTGFLIFSIILSLFNLFFIIWHFRDMSKDLKKAEKICYDHVSENCPYDEQGKLKDW